MSFNSLFNKAESYFIYIYIYPFLKARISWIKICYVLDILLNMVVYHGPSRHNALRNFTSQCECNFPVINFVSQICQLSCRCVCFQKKTIILVDNMTHMLKPSQKNYPPKSYNQHMCCKRLDAFYTLQISKIGEIL